MIIIERHKDGLTVSGHANYAVSGKDIVCAAVSTLAQVFVSSVEKLTNDEMECIISEKDGFLDIEYKELSEKSNTLLASFFIGVEMIAEEYPENVKVNL